MRWAGVDTAFFTCSAELGNGGACLWCGAMLPSSFAVLASFGQCLPGRLAGCQACDSDASHVTPPLGYKTTFSGSQFPHTSPGVPRKQLLCAHRPVTRR